MVALAARSVRSEKKNRASLVLEGSTVRMPTDQPFSLSEWEQLSNTPMERKLGIGVFNNSGGRVKKYDNGDKRNVFINSTKQAEL